MPATSQLRRQVADLACDYREGRLDFRGFMTFLPSEVADSDDEAISELMILVEHKTAADV